MLDQGADISLLSTTKYIEGHNSTVGGSLAARDRALVEKLRFVRKTLGCIQAPFESWLTVRGLKTLPLSIVRCWNSNPISATLIKVLPSCWTS